MPVESDLTIIQGLGPKFGPHHLKGPPAERCLAASREAVAHHLHLNPLSGLRCSQYCAQCSRAGCCHAVALGNDVALLQASSIGRCATADKSDPAAFWHLLACEMSEMARSGVLVVEAASG